jgi:polyferredoxin
MDNRPALFRRVVQFGLFFLAGKWLAVGFLRCPYAVPFMGCLSCPLTDCPGRWLQPFYIAGIAILGFFTGRGFCGWACPMGFLQDAFGVIPKPRATSQPLTIGNAGSLNPSTWFGRLDRVLKWLKWPALLLVLWVYAKLHFTEGRPYPYVVFSSHYLSLHPLHVALALGNPVYIVRVVIFVAALLGALVVVRFWCRYLCPLGALLGVLNRVSLFKMGIVPERCHSCGDCLKVCPMATTPSSVDCTWCTDCLSECSKGAIVVGNRLQRLAQVPGQEALQDSGDVPARPQYGQEELL